MLECHESQLKWMRDHDNIDFAEFDCTMVMVNADDNKHDNHMNFPTVQNVRNRLKEIGCIDENTINVINHFSHNPQMIYEDLKVLGESDGFLCSYDGMTVEF